MTIKEELLELNTTKQGIKEVFEEKGVDLTNKKFSDTPSLIEQMNTGKGDEVEAFAVGAAKEAAADDKVILNYAADMLPEEIELSSSANPGYNNTFIGIYCDKDSIYIGGLFPDSSGNYGIGYFERDATGSYIYKGCFGFSYLPNTACLFKIFSCDGRYIRILDKKTYIEYAPQNFTDYGGITYSSDFKYMATGGSYPRLYKQIDGMLTLLSTTFPTGMQTTFCGMGIVGKNLLTWKNSTLETYSFDQDGSINKVGYSSVQLLNGYARFWRFFDGDAKVVICDSDSIMIFDVTFDGAVYSISKNTELTGLLQSYIVNTGLPLNAINNIFIIDDKDIYMWGNSGIAIVRYESNTLTPIVGPFPDIVWNNRFFINPVDKIAILQTNPKTCYVRYLDAPITQKYVATAAGDGLQFQSVSLTGFVKENNNGILKVSTVLDPNAVVPSYPDTYGLNVTVNAGSPEQIETWTQPILKANGTMGGDSPACAANSVEGSYYAWKAFDGSTSTYWGSAEEATPDWLCFYNPKPLVVSSVSFDFHTEAYASGEIQGSNDNSTWVTIGTFNDNTSITLTVECAPTKGYKYIRAYFTSWYNRWGKVESMTINATVNTYDAGSADISWGWYKSDNEYVKWAGTPSATLDDVEGEKATEMKLYLAQNGTQTVPVLTQTTPTLPKSHLVKEPVYLSDTLDYFMPDPYGLEPSVQYGYDEKAFEQSVLTANGTLGGDSFAVAATDSYSSSYYPYKPFASTTSYGWISNSSASANSPIYYTMYFPDAVCLTQIVQQNRSDGSTETLGDFTIQGSNDNAEWVDIASFSNRTRTANENLTFDLSINTATYNYYRFAITSNSSGNSGRVSIGMLTLTAHIPNSFWAGSVTIDDGWQELEGIRYILPTTTIKEFADVIIGEKATTMYLWLTKTGTTTDFVVSVNAPSGVGSSYQVMPVYLNNALDKFVEEAETVIAVNIADALAGDSISCMKGVSLS